MSHPPEAEVEYLVGAVRRAYEAAAACLEALNSMGYQSTVAGSDPTGVSHLILPDSIKVRVTKDL